MDEYRIDSHKLAYHPERVAAWLRGDNIYPIYMEVGPAGRCQHRCVFCAFDYLGYRGPLISETFIKIVLEQAAGLGLKSVMFAGEGEPLMHPSIIEMISWSRIHNLDVAMTTNGVRLDERRALNALPFLSWIRFSLDAATRETYARIHRCPSAHFDRVIANIARAVEIRRARHCDCTIGVQALLLPQNRGEMAALGELAKGLGADYLTIKPFSKHPLSRCDIAFDYREAIPLARELERFAGDGFRVIFRAHTMEKLKEKRPYGECLGLPFATYIDANGDVYACSAFLGNKDFVYGNIYSECFPAIWEGQRRQQVLRMVAAMGVEKCREVCHLDEMNRYLWQLRHPEEVPHVTFI